MDEEFPLSGRETPARLITTRSDKEVAEDLRQRLAVALAPIADLVNEARAHELHIANLGGVIDQYGRHVFRPMDIQIIKYY